MCVLVLTMTSNKPNVNDELIAAALAGDEVLCRLAREHGATDFNRMLACAAYGGHKSLCQLAKEWGATDFNMMIAKAAMGGHEKLCRLAREWGQLILIVCSLMLLMVGMSLCVG